MLHSGWIERQLRARGIHDERVLAAMDKVPRELFVPEELREAAYADAALPIGSGQTVSQPYVVALIAQELALEGDESVLDVGTGSGYQAAVLAELAAEVHSIERLPELADRARSALTAAGYERVHVHLGDGTFGLGDHSYVLAYPPGISGYGNFVVGDFNGDGFTDLAVLRGGSVDVYLWTSKTQW